MSEQKGHSGRANPEPAAPAGSRAAQRGTEAQVHTGVTSSDRALEWERAEQEHLPPRGTGNQSAETAGTETEQEPLEESPAFRDHADENLQTGGSRGPSNDNRESRGR